MSFYFTADEHFGHRNILKYCGRPFDSVEEMDETIIDNHNKVICKNDTVIHVGDFTLIPHINEVYKKYINRLNGNHVFLMGSHDKWLHGQSALSIWEKTIDKQQIVACHYAMRVWPKSHYGSWQIYGHSHGNLKPTGKQHDVGVDNNNFTPVSFEQLRKIMYDRDLNFNDLSKRFKR